MSRSRRKSPVRGITTSDTEKRDKRIANRRLRLRLSVEPEGVLPALREVSSVWSFDKDGKTRFDPGQWPSLMRK